MAEGQGDLAAAEEEGGGAVLLEGEGMVCWEVGGVAPPQGLGSGEVLVVPWGAAGAGSGGPAGSV